MIIEVLIIKLVLAGIVFFWGSKLRRASYVGRAKTVSIDPGPDWGQSR